MTNASMSAGAPATARTPWHLWLVGGLSLLWNAFGCYDYVMTHVGGAEYLKGFGFTDAQIDAFTAMPWWATAIWALGVWPSLLGSVLLLLRSRYAFPAFVISTVFFGLSLVYQFFLSNTLEVMGFQPMVLVIAAALIFFVWYARAMTKKGVLR